MSQGLKSGPSGALLVCKKGDSAWMGAKLHKPMPGGHPRTWQVCARESGCLGMLLDVPAPLSCTPDLHSDFSNSRAEDVGSDNKQTQVKKWDWKQRKVNKAHREGRFLLWMHVAQCLWDLLQSDVNVLPPKHRSEHSPLSLPPVHGGCPWGHELPCTCYFYLLATQHAQGRWGGKPQHSWEMAGVTPSSWKLSAPAGGASRCWEGHQGVMPTASAFVSFLLSQWSLFLKGETPTLSPEACLSLRCPQFTACDIEGWVPYPGAWQVGPTRGPDLQGSLWPPSFSKLKEGRGAVRVLWKHQGH